MNSMKKKINYQIIGVACTAILVTMLTITGIFYQLFEREVMDDLKIYTFALKSLGVFDDTSELHVQKESEELRITLIAEDGSVLYDNYTDILDMDNHGNRPEVERAFQKGYGEDIRDSQTLNKSTFYYAVLLKNGCVLRVAKEANNVWNLFFKIIPVMFFVLLVLLCATFLLAHYFTKSVVKPIEQMANNLDHVSPIKAYREMQPFIDKIVMQHEAIVKNAKMRQEFTANVSHELKTPLTSISGYAELIENGMATEQDVTRFAGEIHRNSNRLLTLINDIIRLSQLDVVENEPELENVDLHTIAQTAVDMLQLHAEQRGILLKMKGEPVVIKGDRQMMDELVYNLIDNAIRYNQVNGSVIVYTGIEEGEGVLQVADTGIGISKENQKRIFERFFRVDKSHSKQTGGTGLGLAIVKHIVAKHDATIAIDSEIGKGTTISVRFKEAWKKP